MAHMALIGDKDGMGLGLTPRRITAQDRDEDVQHMEADAAQAERFWCKAAIAGSVAVALQNPSSAAMTPNHGNKCKINDLHSPFGGGSGDGEGGGGGSTEGLNTVSSLQKVAG